MELVGLEDVRAAAARLVGVVQRTPLERSRGISGLAGVETLLKCEHLQRTGSFKLRGAYNRIARLSADERAGGVVCASAGNHAQGVALSAQLAGVPAEVFMPVSAPLPKVEATRGYGAHVVLTGESYDDAFAASQEWAAAHDAVFVHAYDHPDVIAGQGTVALELLEQEPEIGTVLVPVGGGGLVSGVAVAVKALRPDVRIVGIQSAAVAAFPASLAAGERRIATGPGTTIADGIAVKTPGHLTLAHVRALVDDVVTVSDEALARAVLLLVERAKQVVEPSGAAGLAALLEARDELGPLAEPVVILLCGGNVDPLLLARIIQSGLFEEGRYTVLRRRLDDRPGSLSRLLTTVAGAGANIVSVSHHRLGTRLGITEVEIELEVETRGPEHIAELRQLLDDAGHTEA